MVKVQAKTRRKKIIRIKGKTTKITEGLSRRGDIEDKKEKK
jgi:hypothetical protein